MQVPTHGLFTLCQDGELLDYPEEAKVPVSKFARSGARLDADVSSFSEVVVPETSWEEYRAKPVNPRWLVPVYFRTKGELLPLGVTVLCVVLKDGRELFLDLKETVCDYRERGAVPPAVVAWKFVVQPRYFEIDGRGQGLRRATVFNR